MAESDIKIKIKVYKIEEEGRKSIIVIGKRETKEDEKKKEI